jgi:hypothetical protein
LGQNTPGILGHQAQDNRETPASVYESNVGMVSGTPVVRKNYGNDILVEYDYAVPIRRDFASFL